VVTISALFSFGKGILNPPDAVQVGSMIEGFLKRKNTSTSNHSEVANAALRKRLKGHARTTALIRPPIDPITN
jgi:hypothetical protein